MTSPATTTASTAGSTVITLRRLIQYILLFALVVIAASGISGLLERLFTSGPVLASADVAGLARSLTFTLIGGPIALLLWWFIWKRLEDESERRAAEWGLYLTGMYAVSLIISTTSLLGLASSLIGRTGSQWAPPLANALVWAAVCVWHRWMWKRPDRPSAHLEDVRAIVGSIFGLVLGAGAAITALSGLFDVAIRGLPLTATVEPWWFPVLRSLVWATGGITVWWWHWFREGGRRFTTGLVDVTIIALGIFAAGITALGGGGVILFVVLRLGFDPTDPASELLEPLAPALAAALIGALIWRYHRTAAAGRSPGAKRAGLLVTSAVALAAAASGVGVIINATLAAAVSPLAGGATRTLLLGGISSLLVGAPVWWLAWKPTRQPQSADDIPPGRRVYLVAFFGVSAVVALIALLVIGYRLFEFLLGDVSGGSLLDRVRAPFGLLVAAALVAGYHFALWRRDRALLAAVEHVKKRTLEQVTLVTGQQQDADALAKRIAEVTGGARVTIWLRADDGGSALPAPGTGSGGTASAAAEEAVQQVAVALEEVTAVHVLVVLGPGARLEVIPLAAGSRR
ncbi:hypothetical protein FBY31_2168 [Arthrobacter sp. SLBN-100]|uniref:DUF5671 domain-containing protein n=1 Tax=Arthrobacter sp. SLBN-100 TaxID=2768450 RepID=UPI001150F472|nr:DUF5671 domain-containing protein [Arthrobacter sp. SLBN-100]TQJ68084.1 hypothetical protein FBY31_2168 [Arthrobacter sp. SLBN-100]